MELSDLVLLSSIVYLLAKSVYNLSDRSKLSGEKCSSIVDLHVIDYLQA